jgi:UDP-N-acetylmuramoyl-tripeptide--D-alanyl-D-alanine ligase
MDIKSLYELYLRYPSVQTDTRQLREGDIFFALKGPNFNGNHYLQQAFEAGASYCVSDEPIDFDDARIIHVNNSLQTLQGLAKMHRDHFTIPFLAITGSNGKTTTKELVSEVLSTQLTTYTTEGNLNNHIGVPLTILKIKRDAEIAVVEMGANHLREIEGYCGYAQPTHGLITNCGKAHLEGFGGEEGIKKGKGELFDWLRTNHGAAFIDVDYDYLLEMSEGIEKIITYGTADGMFVGKILSDEIYLEVSVSGRANIPSIKTHLVGGYNLPNILAAVSVGKFFGISDENIQRALEIYQPTNSRSQLLQKGSNKIILDAYNANPTSMQLAIENFAHMSGDKKVLVLGGMMELGEGSIKEHAAIVDLINKYQWHRVALVGKDYQSLPTGFVHFSSSAEAKDWYQAEKFENAQVLVKGSRSMQMERVIQ